MALGAAGVSETVGGAVRAATARLAKAGSDTPRLDAELLLAEVLGCDRGALVMGARDQLSTAAAESFAALLARRAAREPIAYILGRKEFRGITLAVDHLVLIPRPETELLVEVGLTLPGGAAVVDVGTGSGAVALALKDERPDLRVVGTDISADALSVARENAARLRLDVSFVQADLLDEGRYDAVLANLPYVAEGDLRLAPEVAQYEPELALYGGRDGLALLQRLVGMLDRVSVVALEVGLDQAGSVASLLGEAGFASVTRVRDLAGHERVVVGRR
jgi:release factor glutamine methyltransferase